MIYQKKVNKKKWALFEHWLQNYENETENELMDRNVYFDLSNRPMILYPDLEDDMELLSDIISWGELFLNHWENGTYICSRCDHALYSSTAKWKGPCVWPSFRKAINNDDCGGNTTGGIGSSSSSGDTNEVSLSYERIENYNGYKCNVDEIYCNHCNLFIGHRFEDSLEKGDNCDEATGWRH